MSNQPSINRGILILLAPDATDASVNSNNTYFSFQYNPEKLLHTFNPLMQHTSDIEKENKFTLSEFFNLAFDLDSIEIEAGMKKQIVPDYGLHPALAMLEQMIQPQKKGNQTSMPIIIFKWGQKRILPVQLISMSIEEKTFDQTLNPTRANVSIVLKVLSDNEIQANHAAKKIFANHRNDRAMLAEFYKSQTGQAPTSIKPGATTASATSIKNKTKLKA